MRLSDIILAYFIIGAVMYGGGAINYEDAGLSQYFVDQDGNNFEVAEGNEEAAGVLQKFGQSVTDLIGVALGGIQLVFNLFTHLLGFMNWPIVVLLSNNAPPIAVLLIGGSLEVAFYGGVIRVIMSSA